MTFQPLCCYLVYTNLYFVFVSLAGWDTYVSIVLSIISLPFVSILITRGIIICIIKSISILLLAHISAWREPQRINVLMDYHAKSRSASVSGVCLLQGFFIIDPWRRVQSLYSMQVQEEVTSFEYVALWCKSVTALLSLCQLTIRFVRSNYSFVICLRSECLTRCRSVVQLLNCSFVYSILIISLVLLGRSVSIGVRLRLASHSSNRSSIVFIDPNFNRFTVPSFCFETFNHCWLWSACRFVCRFVCRFSRVDKFMLMVLLRCHSLLPSLVEAVVCASLWVLCLNPCCC